MHACTRTQTYTHRDIQGQETFLEPSCDKQTATMTQSAQTTIPPHQP